MLQEARFQQPIVAKIVPSGLNSRGWSTRGYRAPEAFWQGGLENVQPNTSRLEAVYGHSLIINPYQGMYQEIHPCMAGSIDSVKINTSLLMMRECTVSHCYVPLLQRAGELLRSASSHFCTFERLDKDGGKAKEGKRSSIICSNVKFFLG